MKADNWPVCLHHLGLYTSGCLGLPVRVMTDSVHMWPAHAQSGDTTSDYAKSQTMWAVNEENALAASELWSIGDCILTYHV